MADISGSLRERKKAATEAALQRSALSLFVKKGYERTTIEEIVADADVSRRTFFRYFGSKEEVIFKDAATYINAFKQFLHDRPNDESELQALKESLVTFVDYLQDRQAPVLKFVNVVLSSSTLRARSAELQGRWSAGAAEELASRAGTEVDLRRRVLAGIGIAILTAAIQAWTGGATPELGEAVRDAFAYVENGSLLE